MRNPRRLWPQNSRPVNEEYDGDHVGVKSDRIIKLLNDYNRACGVGTNPNEKI